MNSIGPDQAIQLLEQDKYRYLSELTAIGENIPDVPRQIFGDSHSPSSLMIVESFPHGTIVTMCGLPEKDFLDNCFTQLHSNHDQFTLSATEPEVFHQASLKQQFSVDPISCIRCLVCTNLSSVPSASSEIVKLESGHASLLLDYPQEVERYRPSLEQLFQSLVIDAEGEIYGVESGNILQGYLACMPSYREIWDVGFIHVVSSHRSQGLGHDLAAYYAYAMLTSGRIPYYSSPQNKASVRAALGVGFEYCRSLYSSEVSRRTDT